MLSIIVPCYNEEATLPLFVQAVEEVNQEMQQEIEYIFVNDGSKDQTLQVIKKLYHQYPESIRFISFSRNFGKESALYAGLQAAKGELITVMDADLQDPPELLPEMLRLIETGEYDCIGTRRQDRAGEPPIRSFFAKLFYRLVNKIGQTEMVDGARDFRLMTRQMVDAVLELTEYNRFSKGIFSWVGFNTKYLSFENRERVAGETSWSFWSLFRYSIDGIVNFSEAPLNIASIVGALSCIGSLIALIFIVVRALLFWGHYHRLAINGVDYAFVGGLQLLCLGIIGKYIGKIFMETKKRPIYLVKETEEDIKGRTLISDSEVIK